MSLTQRKSTTWEERRGRPHTPLKAKKLLVVLRVPQVALARTLGLNESAVTLMLTRDIWPARQDTSQLREAFISFLRERGASEEDIEVAFEKDDGPYQPRTSWQSQTRTGRATAPIDDVIQLPENEMLTQNARRHFTLFRDPFQDDVQGPEDVFLSDEHRYVREAMFTTAKHGGFLAVIGESGAGKTVLRRDLIDRIRREEHPITCIQPRIIDKERLTAGSICDAIIADLSQERPRRSLEAKARQIEQLLTGSSRAGNNHVLLIEEAHDLAVPTLKYLKRFYELEDGFRKLLSIILIGQPELKGKLDERQNWQAREVIRRCEIAELLPLGGDLEGYLKLKLNRLNKGLDDVFEKDAFDAIRARLTHMRGAKEGIGMHYPLVVNNMVVKCLNLAAEVGSARVSSEIVRGV
ncbi:MAG: AAA family ATPase [Gammaproteobacteria bacterium]|nr:AAA family ATPase [Gammaproteobacteria bacterium]